MAYSTIDDLQHVCGGAVRLVQLTDWNGDRAPDIDVIATAIGHADSLIDSHLNKIYTVPIAAPPPDIVRISSRLARFEILEARGLVDDHVMKSYEADIKWLEAVRDGQIVLGVQPQPDASDMRKDASTPRPLSKSVSRKRLSGFS